MGVSTPREGTDLNATLQVGFRVSLLELFYLCAVKKFCLFVTFWQTQSLPGTSGKLCVVFDLTWLTTFTAFLCRCMLIGGEGEHHRNIVQTPD